MRQVDCIIVGGGPAGMFCASTLMKNGIKCLVLERRSSMKGKVCGGGVSRFGVHVLEQINFPIELLLHHGVKIEQKITIIDNQPNINTNWQEDSNQAAFSIGIQRDTLDEIFMQNALAQGVEIILDFRVKKITQNNNLYFIGDFSARKLVFANGAGGVCHERLPAGISAIYKSEHEKQGVFLFDESACHEGYGWIFSIGHNLWNVGVWSRQPQFNLKKQFFQFLQTRVSEFLGDSKCLIIPRGCRIGAGKPVNQCDPNIYIAGDAANCAVLSSGEGIPQAILSGISTAEKIISELR